MLISQRWAQYRVLRTIHTSFRSSLAFALRGRQFLLFWDAFSGRYFILSMFECHVRFERIFDKISEYVELQNRWILLYQSLPLHHSPGFWLVVPGKRRLGSSGKCVTATAGNHHPHIRGQGQVLVFQQQFWSIFAVFSKKILLPSIFLQKCERGFSTSSRAKVFSRLKLVWASSFR